MKLVDNWKDAWKWFSVQSMAIAGGALGAWAALPTDLKNTIPAEWVTAFSAAVLVLGIVGRLVSQAKK